MANTKTSSLPADLSFEEALKELESIVRKLEGSSGDLEASIADYVRGTELKKFCDEKLKSARLKVESIVRAEGESAATAPFDPS
ncbi:MAG: exodeoxyribonuclease VII small subunit [Alphaproteobacteria bacterium]|nr:exodeoxyribonuclease VII small subunit [Alphaproteobacteria bacterium]